MKNIQHIVRDIFPKNIRLKLSVPEDAWSIRADPTQIHQVLLNLCVNARDAMPHGGTLTIGMENRILDEQYAAMNIEGKPGSYLVISVVDTGTGIAPEAIDKVFEPFFTTKELGKGTGLGLSSVLAIVKSHQGFIKAISEPGNGATFRIYLPARQSSEIEQAPSEEDGFPRGNGETILVVDDEAAILKITRQTLKAFGYQVLTASDGAEAVALFAQRKHEIDVVLTDMMMPLMDGPAAIHALLRIHPAVKIVAASGLKPNGSAAKPLEGVKYFLSKPYTTDVLLKTLRAILRES